METAGAIRLRHEHPAVPEGLSRKKSTEPPLVIFITRSPYGTEMALGALSFAVACAHGGIETRVVFIENGVYALTGDHRQNPVNQFFNVQDVVNSAVWGDRLQIYAFHPSFVQRGVTKNKKITAALEIGVQDLVCILFETPAGISSDHQRVLFF